MIEYNIEKKFAHIK